MRQVLVIPMCSACLEVQEGHMIVVKGLRLLGRPIAKHWPPWVKEDGHFIIQDSQGKTETRARGKNVARAVVIPVVELLRSGR